MPWIRSRGPGNALEPLQFPPEGFWRSFEGFWRAPEARGQPYEARRRAAEIIGYGSELIVPSLPNGWHSSGRLAIAAPLRMRYGLLTHDSILLATALDHGIAAFASADRDFERVETVQLFCPTDLESERSERGARVWHRFEIAPRSASFSAGWLEGHVAPAISLVGLVKRTQIQAVHCARDESRLLGG